MTNSKSPVDEEPAQGSRRSRLKTALVVVMLIVLLGAGSAVAFHFLNVQAHTPTIADIEELKSPETPPEKREEAVESKPIDERKMLLGSWKRPDYYGDLTLDLNEDGTAIMVIDFNVAYGFLVTDRLEVDIEWEFNVDKDRHLIFNSIRGRPANKFEYVTKLKGNKRDQILMHLDENTFVTTDADDKSKIKKWTRVKANE